MARHGRVRQGSRIVGFLKGVVVGLLLVIVAIAALVLLVPAPEEVASLDPQAPELTLAEPDVVATEPEPSAAEPGETVLLQPAEGQDEITPVEIEGLGPVVEVEDPLAELGEPTEAGEAVAGADQSAEPGQTEEPPAETDPLAEPGQTLPYLDPNQPGETAERQTAETGTEAADEGGTDASAEAGADTLAEDEPAMPPPLADAGSLALSGPALEVNAARYQAPENGPLIGVIVDDAAGGGLPADVLLSLPLPVTLGIVPGRDGDADLARRARARNWEVLAQIPVAADADGPAGALAEGMDEDEVRARTEALLARLDQAVAATGGQGLEDMAPAVLATLEAHGFGYLGNASAGAGGPASAEIDQSVPSGATAEDAVAALDAAAATAGQDGTAIVVLPPTREALEGLIRWSLERGAQAGALAPVSAVIRRQGAG